MGYHQLTYRERYLIARHKSSGESVRAIGKMLGRSASTISRELRRNADRGDRHYRVDKADSYARARRWRSRMGPGAIWVLVVGPTSELSGCPLASCSIERMVMPTALNATRSDHQLPSRVCSSACSEL